MKPDYGPPTSLGLFDRLREEGSRQAAWGEFVARYESLLYQWCRRTGLQASDAQDLAQETLLVLLRVIPDFQYDSSRSFRGWMRSVAHSVWYHKFRAGVAVAVGGGFEALSTVAARDDLVRRFEALANQELLDRASMAVRQRVTPQTWEAFRLTVVEDQPAGEAARALELPIDKVYQARYRVQRLLREEIEVLDPEP